MKNHRHTYLPITAFLLLTSFLAGCEKDDTPSDSKTIEGILYYYTNEETKELRAIDIDDSSPFRRNIKLTDDYTLEDLANDRDDLVIRAYLPSNYSSLYNKKGLMLKPKVVEGNWLFVTTVPFPGITGATDDDYSEASDFPNDATGFIFHKTGEIDGEVLYAIESAGYPGRYFTHSGNPIQGANLLYLDEYPEPKDAPKFRLYRPKSTFREGDPSVPERYEIEGW